MQITNSVIPLENKSQIRLAFLRILSDECHVMRGGTHMKPVVKEQILAVRDTGETNMFDVNTVMQIAIRKGIHELVVFLTEHRSEYARFILTGDID